ncbi:MAG: YtxH domain-containing protein [Cyclobacteriaceae bacterium]|jgi:gas vesicle protein|nr:YtxH domain-containing protein [Flammeovirgaceae bacterium]MCZ8020413.1 YtxH domain-containing protein [Cytophagales bacterium]MCZ8328143.1 YtxH domain-containing protein [Cyclobacteriaceae bacterium]
MNTKYLLGGLLAGAAIGVAIGILIAPQSGAETRTALKKGTGKLKDDLQNKIDDAVSFVKGKLNFNHDELTKNQKEIAHSQSSKA